MARNKLLDLNDHLMAQMERLEDEELTGDKLDDELKRSKAMEGLAKQIISNARLTFDAAKAVSEGKVYQENLPKQLGE